MIALDKTKLAAYEDDSIYSEFNDGGNINDQALIATTGSSIESFKPLQQISSTTKYSHPG